MDKEKIEKVKQLYKLCDELGVPRPVIFDGVWRVESEKEDVASVIHAKEIPGEEEEKK